MRRWAARYGRSPLARRLAARLVGAWALALLVTVFVTLTVSDAQAARRAWGATSEVLVMVRTVPSGEPLTPEDTELQHWPDALVPPEAVTHLQPGRRLAATAHEGEVLLSSRLARSGAGPTAAMLPDRAAAIAVPLGAAPPPIDVGDRVDVLATTHGDPWEQGDAAAVTAVARDAEVVELGDGHATIVVSRSEVEATVAAILAGSLTVVLTG